MSRRNVNVDSTDRSLATVQDIRARPRARDIVHAGARGAVAAMAMTGVRAVTGGLGIVKQTPPQAMIRHAAPRLLKRAPRRHLDEAIELAHWGYGTVGGMAYGALPGRWRRPPWSALAYGLVLWAGFEAVLAPTFDLNRRRGSNLTSERAALALDHLLYGLVLSEIRPAHKAMR